ncbi:MAG TPA: PilZ domain-containing protein [Thermotogota bacterium]|nr:PilZ domain-containing protein [Thermotogota bacterium]
MILIQNLSKLLKLSCWKSMLELPGRSLFSVFLGTYKDLLLFESRVFQISADLRNNSEIAYQIFLPLGIIRGVGRLKEQMVKDDPVYGKVKRLLVSPGQTMVSQKRNFKRYFLLENGIIEHRGQSAQVIVKDVSMAGIGVSSGGRLLSEEGTIRFLGLQRPIRIKKVYEFTNYNFFEYGFLFQVADEEQKNELKRRLLVYHQKLTNIGVSH